MQLEPDADGPDAGIHAVHFTVTKSSAPTAPRLCRSLRFISAEADPATLRFAVCLNAGDDAVDLVEVDYDAAVAAAKFDQLVDDLAAASPGAAAAAAADPAQPQTPLPLPQSPEQLLAYAAALLQRARARWR